MKIGIEYCAGLLEGEGSFGIHNTGVLIQCSMTDLEPLLKLKKYLGGNISGPYKHTRDSTYKLSWKWSISRRQNVISICKQLSPFMSPRRKEQIEKVLAYHKKNPKLLRDRPVHGTISMYSNQKCRYYPCKKAHRTYINNWRVSKCV